MITCYRNNVVDTKEKIEKSAMPSGGISILQGCRRLLVLSEERLQRSFIL
jgi:hypothetical protein